jgi:hypothetical protein
VVRGLVSLAGWDTEEEATVVEENLLKPKSEVRGLAFAGLRDFFVGANVADANISAALLGFIAERQCYVGSRERKKKQGGKIWRGPDRIVKGRSKIIEPFMATGVGAARYEDLNSDLPVCISQDFLHIQTVTGLRFSSYICIDYHIWKCAQTM